MVGDPSDQDSTSDPGEGAPVPTVPLTETQHRIIAALCRPARGENRYATPATNQEIAAEVFLSVDAVKAHLRTLYRKFGIEDLPHNRKRARLVELALEGGYLGPDAPAPVPDGSTRPEAGNGGGGAAPGSGAAGARVRRFGWPAAALALLLVVVIAAGLLVLGGTFSSSEGDTSTGVAAYKADARKYCQLALSGEDPGITGTTAARALSYLEVIETLRGRLDSVPAPAGTDPSLERFRDGLARAATFTGIVAEGPPATGSREQNRVVAELTIAAGQVQAGAIGYQLGASCQAVGDLVARSARNAAAAP